MNERILELAKQACITIVPEPFDDASRSWNDTMEKFAQLIVKECVDIVEHSRIQGDEGVCLVGATKNKIKQHFGVEL